jgi:Gamma-glutamyl cyclotransferase, AIG2-like
VEPLTSNVFFYGLFMDAAVLEAKGVRGTGSQLGIVRHWSLCIGQRATLAPASGQAVHGVLMRLSLSEVERLYAEDSVRMYRPIAVLVETDEAEAVAALAYVLPEPPAPQERNPEYASRLRALAERLGLPPEYTRSIA